MITGQSLIDISTTIGLVLLSVAFFLTVLRVMLGPTLPDRVVALDMLVAIVIGFIAVFAIRTGYTLYIDIAISLGLVGFLSTVAFARFILVRGVIGESPETEPARQAVEKQFTVEKLRNEKRQRRMKQQNNLSQKETDR
ncbi:cation:proton antiporter [Allorhizobium sp. BGMRC 0089]|uniref:cation:proton antiporter n=1 Tax=Allorhizobium sonneratiae TaxID=2934936 RepID=UPI002033E019|nr:cation:proton antiporter [Allorhizobium sonneratiae]MCM2291870.1 cation:proton antiporter [Allorhizobium sonneratiae]